MIQQNGNVYVLYGVSVMPKGWRNFSGRPTEVNPAGGSRYFNIEISDPNDANFLMAQGAKLFLQPPYREGDPDKWRMEIKLSYRFGHVPIHIRLSDGRLSNYTENDVGTLDVTGIKNNAVVAFALSHWKRGKEEGNTAYLRSAAFDLWAGDPLDGIWTPSMPGDTGESTITDADRLESIFG